MKKKSVLRMSLSVVLFLLLGICTLIHAAVIQVTTTIDNVPGSLRAAITRANSNNEGDNIYLPVGTYILSGEPGEDANAGGDLDINTNHSITIIGGGPGITIIDGIEADRVLHILNGTVSITGVTIRNGNFKCVIFEKEDGSKYVEPEHGGGIYNSGTLTLNNCTVSKNSSKDGCFVCYGGGGCAYCSGSHGGGIYNTGSLELKNCTISENNSGNRTYAWLSHTGSGNGGGIYNTGSLYMSDCVVKDNITGFDGGHGGGIYNFETGTMIIERSTISDNKANDGGWERHVDIGTGGGFGGGIFNCGKANLYFCTINNNSTGVGGFGDWVAGFAGNGGGISNTGKFILENSTITANTTGDWNAGAGGGISSSGEMTITNCTISENTTGNGIDTNTGEHFSGSGGGIFVSHGKVTLISCTVCNNHTGQENVEQMSGHGCVIYVENDGKCFLKNTIVANNHVYPGNEGPDCWGTLTSQGYNLIENTNNCVINGELTGNIPGIDPLLAPLANNGGLTLTHALLINSPAVDAGTSTGISSDQRGYTRPVDITGIPNMNGGADIGAYELSSRYYISGRITCDNTGLAGVTLTFSHGGGSTFTDANGDYTHPTAAGWSGIVTPSKDDYTFTPAFRSYSGVSAIFTHQDYTASPFSVSVSITHPEERTTVSDRVTIEAAVSSNPGDARITTITKVEFYIDGTILGEDTTPPFQYDWNTGFSGNGDHIIKVKAYNAAGLSGEDEITVTVSNTPYISVNRSQLNFRYFSSGASTFHQDFSIINSGSGLLNWIISEDKNWLSCSPNSGTNSAVITVTVNRSSELTPGTHTGIITIESPFAANSPQTVTVNLTVSKGSNSQPPFGSFDTPIAGSTVMSSVPFTGWVLDDIKVKGVKIYRQPAPGEGTGLVYIGNALFVEGARPDIEQQYPDYPNNYKAGWGYMLLTNFLPDGGNGYYTFHVIAEDWEEHAVTLATKTVFCDNQNAVKPFGAIDTPVQGGKASGPDFVNFAWALTPLPNTIPRDGSTMNVWVDGVPLGNPVYNRYRRDIAGLFPGYNNSNGAGGHFYLDTTPYENGMHTIAWSVKDDAGNINGIGSRYFTIWNTGETASVSQNRSAMFKGEYSMFSADISQIPLDDVQPILVKKGYNQNIEPKVIYHPDDNGNITIEIKELERVEVWLSDNNESPTSVPAGFQLIGDRLAALPIGSFLDYKNGIFYWQPGPGFLGFYELVFIEKIGGEMKRKLITVRIKPQ
jgi:hypothetical protein